MADVEIREFSLPEGCVPGPVSLTLSDHPDPEQANTILQIQVPLAEPGTRDFELIQIKALGLVHGIIDEEITRLKARREARSSGFHRP